MKVLLSLLICVVLSSCSHVFYQPGPKQYLDPTQFKIPCRELSFNSLDGTKLYGWFFPSSVSKPKGTIVHFHGNAQNMSTHFLNLQWMMKEGYNIFIFDYRGYWKSEGKPSQAGIYKDALAAMEKGSELHRQHGEGLFVIYGQSLGGIISLRALADFQKRQEVDLIVQDSTFSSYKDIAFDKLTSRWFLVPMSPLAFVLVSDEYASDEVFEKIDRPLLVIVGEKDEIIPSKFGKKIYRGVRSEKKWI